MLLLVLGINLSDANIEGKNSENNTDSNKKTKTNLEEQNGDAAQDKDWCEEKTCTLDGDVNLGSITLCEVDDISS